MDEQLGKAGDVHTLNLLTLDRSDSLSLMARLVRVITIDDIWRGKIRVGAAWEFLFQKGEQRREIERFVSRVAELQKMEADGLDIAYQYNAQVDGDASGTRPALVTNVWPNGMLIETDWPVKQGEKLNVEIEAPASKKKMRLIGQAISSKTMDRGDSDRYQVEIKFVRPKSSASRSGGDTIANAVDQLLSETAKWSVDMLAGAREHLKGDLAQIRLSSMLAFIELERMSGIVRLEQDSRIAQLFICNGRVVDALSKDTSMTNPIALLSDLLQWTKGVFEFRIEEIERDDKIGMSTSALLIDLASREDELRSTKD